VYWDNNFPSIISLFSSIALHDLFAYMTSPEYPEKLQDEKIRELKTMYNMKS